jgi:hypothetical protein
MSRSKQAFENAKRAVVQVGDGRGFVVGAGEYDRYVITAAHCLPRQPKPHLANGVPELTYANLVGPLAKDERTIWAGLVVNNLVDDVADAFIKMPAAGAAYTIAFRTTSQEWLRTPARRERAYTELGGCIRRCRNNPRNNRRRKRRG